jgi:uncharacterized Zn finger protein
MALAVSEEMAAKVDRILTEGRIRIIIPGHGLQAQVQGDHGLWHVRLRADGSGECQCPAWTRSNRLVCSHLLALQRVAGSGGPDAAKRKP